jgi:hypothetical protein
MGNLEGKVDVITGGNSGIASSDSSFLLGAEIVADGGMSQQ